MRKRAKRVRNVEGKLYDIWVEMSLLEDIARWNKGNPGMTININGVCRKALLNSINNVKGEFKKI